MAKNLEILDWIQKPISQISLILATLCLCWTSLALQWISTLPCFLQILLGISVGLSLMGSHSIHQSRRGLARRLCSVRLAQLSLADMASLKKILPDHEKALSWLPDPGDAEPARWINAGVEKLWPVFKEACLDMIIVELHDVLNKYKPQVIQDLRVAKLELGNSCPYVQGIKAVHEQHNRISFEVQIDWRDNENQQMVLHVSTSGPKYIVQVKHFVIYAVAKVTFIPFKEELPCFGAMTLSIIEPPLIDFQSKFLSGSLGETSELEKAVDGTLLATLMDILVWPNRVVVPFIPGDYSDLEASFTGILNVRLVKAKDLVNRYMTGRSNPYALLFIRRVDSLTKRSKSVPDASDPIWNEDFQFNIEDTGVQRLTVKVMNSNDGLDVCMGTAEVPIRQLEENIPKDIWIDLVGDSRKFHEKYAGRVHLVLELKQVNSIINGGGGVPPAFMIPESSKAHRSSAAVIKATSAMEGLKAALEITNMEVCRIDAPNPPESTTHPDFSMMEPNLQAVNTQIAIGDAKSDGGGTHKSDAREICYDVNDIKAGIHCHGSMDRSPYQTSLGTEVCKDGVDVGDSGIQDEEVPNMIESEPEKIENDAIQDNIMQDNCIELSVAGVIDTSQSESLEDSQLQDEETSRYENAPKSHPVAMGCECIGAMDEAINAGPSIGMSPPKLSKEGNSVGFGNDRDADLEEIDGEYCTRTSQMEIKNRTRCGDQAEPERNVSIDDLFDSEIFEVD